MPLESLHSGGISFTMVILGFCVKETDVSEANQTPKSLKAQITRTSLVLARRGRFCENRALKP